MSVSWIQSIRLAAVLENCSDQLDIMTHTLTVRISREGGAGAAQEKARLAKLRTDCQYISQQVLMLCLELEKNQSFSSLLQVVEMEEKRKANSMRRDPQQELEQTQQSQRRYKEVQQKFETLENPVPCAKELKHSSIANKRRFAEKSIELQVQPEQKDGSHTEKLLEEQLELLQKQLKAEVRVHEESKKFLQHRHEELQEQLQQWQQHTKQMLQEKEQQLNSVCCKRTVSLDRLMEMRRIFTELQQVVLEDREEQEKLRQQEAEVRAATKLQAWWRGCMVRRGLGSFKVEEEKKGKKKKKKEGKKKKK